MPISPRCWQVGGLAAVWSAVGAPVMALCPAALPTALETIAAQPSLTGARLGVHVETLTGEAVVSREGDRFFVPASTLKLLTTAAVLTELGPDYTLQTSVLGTTSPEGRTTLQVIGGGDPSFDQASLAALASQIAQQPIQSVDVLYGDDSAFPGDAVNPNWEWEDVQAGYGAPVNALILNENEIVLSLVPQGVGEPLQVVWDEPRQGQGWQIENYSTTVAVGEPEYVSVGRELGLPVLRVWGQLIAGSPSETTSIAEPNPGQAFLDALQRGLAAQGIRVQQTRLTAAPAGDRWTPLATITSPPLAELLIPTNQNSNNLYAEALLKTLGRQDAEATDATESGVAIARQVLAELGMDVSELVMVDGSGLARKNLVTPRAMVDVLQGMARSPHFSTYRDSLAVAGLRGTLRNRLKDTPAEGRLYGKSGAISRNFALAGYLDPPNYELLAFSIFINNINARGSTVRPIIDDIILQLTDLDDCE
ncbi:D-alanyl-D-alanine carboxypeptidase/D-alanyl-D-alanine endopeptidase [Leptolyngbya iicbica]|uniref:D-alanyl-D-alanine carboxypeptidase/D-alanyl-D-alanine-endopeptidase n=2 Tax=Cyanophyceae TaxID=3028117 RepID=A0A4Q7E1Z7_9CYAN|nr:D-alanyl-D-alanine carboxypeptidase/D-alanyl-D-alanine-endopeptidase [Leptolyngbya sp. LK]RZM75369.1 D-alanyl-D-alanine carboxypeptidase/D-alanyl-D-alanine-endopeptidase [Leptolyngbya sp. LK]